MSEWWSDLTAAALVGTGRRPLAGDPPAPVVAREGASREVALMDAAALGSALHRAGRTPLSAPPTDAAPDDVLDLAPTRARQLLDLLLHQPPVGPQLRPHLVMVWLEHARTRGLRVSHARIPELLDLATTTTSLRPAVRSVIDRRGVWLAGARPTWSWVLAPLGPSSASTAPADVPTPWSHLDAASRAALVADLRRTDPAAARDLVESVWSAAPAPERTALIGALRTGVGPDDAIFLERALDDRAGGVRTAAYSLLDAVPDSPRGARLGEMLASLVRVHGRFRRTLEVELPTDPEPAGVRDGLGAGPRGRSQRGWWLQRIVAGAPLEVWTDATGADPLTTLKLVSDTDARAGLREAVLARSDAAWARALLLTAEGVWDAALLGVLPAQERQELVGPRLARSANAVELVQLIDAVPGPWGLPFSRAVLACLTDPRDEAAVRRTEQVLHSGLVALATRLHPDTRSTLQAWAERRGGPQDPVTQISQYVALTHTLAEAFR